MNTLALGFDEPASAYACRQGRRLGLSMRSWCTDLGFTTREVTNGVPDVVRRIADIGGVDPDALIRSTVRVYPDRNWILNGEQLTQESLRRARPRGCIHCMMEQLDGGDFWHVSAQNAWSTVTVRTCPIHQVPLVNLGISRDASLHEWSIVAETFLRGPGSKRIDQCHRQPGVFESYVVERVHNHAPSQGGELNQLELHVAMRLVPIIGQTLLRGTCAAEPVSDDEYMAASDAGYEALRKAGGLEDALSKINASAGRRKFNQGPQHRLGRHFYDWLSRAANHPGYATIKERTREFILDNIPVDRGRILLGHVVGSCRVHNVATLSALTGHHHVTLRRNLLHARLLESDSARGDLPMRADKVEGWAMRMRDVIGPDDVPKVLGCSRSHYLTLSKAGIIEPVSKDPTGKRKRYERKSINDVLRQLLGSAQRTAVTPDGYVNIDQIGKMAVCSIADIINATLSGGFKGLACRPDNHRLDGLEFDVAEAKRSVRGEPLPGLGLCELTALWGMPHYATQALINYDHLPTVRARHPVHKGHVSVVPFEAIESFERTYIHFRELMARTGLDRNELQQHLSAKSVLPAFDPDQIPSPLYRRADITD